MDLEVKFSSSKSLADIEYRMVDNDPLLFGNKIPLRFNIFNFENSSILNPNSTTLPEL